MASLLDYESGKIFLNFMTKFKDYFYKYIKNIIKDDLYLKEFLNKGLVDGSIIDEESVSRTLFIINVIYHHAVENNIYLILVSEVGLKFILNMLKI